MKANCTVCGKEYDKRDRSKTCSAECRKRRHNEYMRRLRATNENYRLAQNARQNEKARLRRLDNPKTGVCVICGQVFRRMTPAKTCSKECSAQLDRKRMQNWRMDRIASDPSYSEYRREQSRLYRSRNSDRERERFLQRCATDPEFLKKLRARKREWVNNRYRNDRAFRNRRIEYSAARGRLLRVTNPEHYQRACELFRKRYANDHEFREKCKARSRAFRAALQLGIPPLLYAAMKILDIASPENAS